MTAGPARGLIEMGVDMGLPLLANGATPTGPDTLLLVIGGVGLAAGVGLLAANRSRTPALALVGIGLALAVAAFVVPGLGEQRPDAQVQILAPQAGTEVSTGDTIKVEVNVVGGEIATSPTDEEGGHLHLYVDDLLQQMPYTTDAEVVILEPGSHTIRVEFVDHQHISYDPPIEATVEVSAG